MMKLFSRKPSDQQLRARSGEAVTARLEAVPGIRRAPPASAQIYMFDDYLTPAECEMLIAKIDEQPRPSTLLAPSGDAEFRTSHSCDLDRWNPEIRAVDERIAALLGIAPEYGETLQGQRYAPGQQFKAHCDYFHEGEAYWQDMVASGGQRTWTAMIFLNHVKEGGATWFPRAGIRITPKPGMLLVWNNLLPGGAVNGDTLHEGMRVLAGTKYIVTKWFRERPWLAMDIPTY